MSRDAVVLLLALGTLAAGCGPWRDAHPHPVLAMQPVATAPVPLSSNESLALVDEQTACVIVSYEFQVHCVDRSTRIVGVFGREGEGPGEFQFPSEVFQGPGTTVGVIDGLSARATIFRPTGAVVSEAGLPPQFMAIGSTEAMVIGVSERFEAAFDPSAAGMTLAGIELGTGVARVEEKLPSPAELGIVIDCDSDDLGTRGAWHPGGWLVFGMCQHDLAFVDAPGEVAVPTLVRAPTYTGELPNQRDIAEYRTGMGLLYGGTVPEVVVQQYAATPKIDRVPGRSLRYDSRARLWVGSNRDRDRYSYFDIYVGTDFKGSVRIRDRLIGFDLLGETLATLVERAVGEGDADGIPDRAIDWYDVSGLGY